MNDYIETRLDFSPCQEYLTDLAAAALSEAGYESFVPDAQGLTAYIPVAAFSEDAVAAAIAALQQGEIAPLAGVQIAVSHTHIEGQDWNEEWEKNYFQPIVIGNKCVIHSSFHTDYPHGCPYDIVIDPKMAFGTGHHATTTLILSQLMDADLQGRALIDVGTGTGILAILAAMRGAVPVAAIEIDPPAWENAVDNVRTNHHPEIAVLLGDASLLSALPPADFLVANINRNIVIADMPRYARALRPGATAFFSGFYQEDVPLVAAAARAAGLTPLPHTSLDNWACLPVKK